MKKIIYTFIVVLLTLTVGAQLDRSKQPRPGPAPKVQLGNYQLFALPNGLKVIVVEDKKIPKVTYQLFLDSDPIQEKEFAGYSSFAGTLLRTGTISKSKAEIDEAIDFIGASLNTSTSGISGSVLKKHSNVFLELMADILFNPAFPAEELEKLKKQSISGIQAGKTEAQAIAQNINSVLLYGNNHPYGEILSEKTINNITLEKCKDYYNTYFKPNNAYLVIVGDITLAEAKSQSIKYFGGWKKGIVPKHTPAFPELNKSPKVVIGNRDGAVQSHIIVSFPLQYVQGNPDALKTSVMNNILGGGSLSSRINANLREKRSYTYGAYSTVTPDKFVGNFTASGDVKGASTETAMQELLFEIKRMINEPVNKEMVEQVKSLMAGSFARSLESPQTIANFALNIERFKLPKDYYATYLQKLSNVSAADVQAMAKKYLKPENANIIAVGNAEMLQKTMQRFAKDGVIEMRDFYGNIVKAAEVPANITASDVISKYIQAIGGKEKVEGVKNVVTKMSMSMQGMKIEIVSKQKAPDKLCIESLMGEKVVSKQVFNGTNGKVVSPMGEKELSGNELLEMKNQAVINPELQYEAMGIKTELKGQEDVEGNPAWKIQLSMPTGKTSVDFYDLKSGLKVKSVGQAGQVSLYGDYKPVEGVLYPFSLKQMMGPQTIELKVDAIEVNKGIDDKEFN